MAKEFSVQGYQYYYDDKGNVLFTVSIDDEGNMYFWGKHSKSTSTYTYHTFGFYMTLERTNKNPLQINNKTLIKRYGTDKSVDIPKSFESSYYTIDTYQVNRNELISSLAQLLKNQGYTTQKAYKKIAQGIDVYFSNIFEVITRDNQQRVGTEEYYSYNDICKAIYDLTGQHWKSTTEEILKNYYDNIIHISLSPFFYNVVYVDASDYAKNGTKSKVLKQGPENQEIFFGQYTGFETPTNQQITINNKKYTISSAEYIYTDGQKNKLNPPIISNNGIEAYHGLKQNATMYILLKPSNTPTLTPTPRPTQQPKPDSHSNVVRPSVTSETLSYFEPDPLGNINVHPKSKTGFDAKIGVPTTEKLYGSIQTSEYLLNIVYEKKSGQITYPITVQKTYYVTTNNSLKSTSDSSEEYTTTTAKGKTTSNNIGLKYAKASKDESEEDTYTITPETVTQSGRITRSYSYTEIIAIDYYKIKNGTLTNQTLPGTTITLVPKNYSVPYLSYEHYDSQSQHIKVPSEIGKTIVLPSEDVSSLLREDLIASANSQVGSISVRNDLLTFDGTTVLNNAWKQRTTDELKRNAVKAAKKTAQQVLYADNLLIEETLQNKTYMSSGTISYEKVVTFNSSNSDILTYSIDKINNVNIHTPVYCKTMIAHDNGSYLQLMNPDERSIPIILDENSEIGDFTLQISNQGYHSEKPGYGEKNYTKYLAKNNEKPQNEVKFPIEIYI